LVLDVSTLVLLLLTVCCWVLLVSVLDCCVVEELLWCISDDSLRCSEVLAATLVSARVCTVVKLVALCCCSFMCLRVM